MVYAVHVYYRSRKNILHSHRGRIRSQTTQWRTLYSWPGSRRAIPARLNRGSFRSRKTQLRTLYSFCKENGLASLQAHLACQLHRSEKPRNEDGSFTMKVRPHFPRANFHTRCLKKRSGSLKHLQKGKLFIPTGTSFREMASEFIKMSWMEQGIWKPRWNGGWGAWALEA